MFLLTRAGDGGFVEGEVRESPSRDVLRTVPIGSAREITAVLGCC